MKKKLSHIWYYYKWYILAALLVLWVAADFVLDLRNTREADAVVSIVTVSPVSDQTREHLQGFLEEAFGDRNGDGEVLVELNVYAYDGKEYTGNDPEGRAAAAVHLAAEAQSGDTDLFLSDAWELMEDGDKLTRWGTWEDFGALTALDCPELAGFGVYGFPEKTDSVLEVLG